MIFYKLLSSLLYFITYPFMSIIFRKQNFAQRVSFRPLQIDSSVWIHAASLGEVNAVKSLVKRLLETYNNETFVMTAVTKTGFAAAKEISGKLIVHQFPLDIAHLMNKAFRIFKPRLIILVETELWPIMLNVARKRGVPVIIINARLSRKSFKRYKFFKPFIKKDFANIKLVCAQSDKDADLFRKLKLPKVINASNLKFDMEMQSHEMHTLRNAYHYKFNDFIITLGCSRPGEEAMIKKVYEKLCSQIQRLKIIIVPRHLHRLGEITALFKKDEYSLFSESKTGKPFLIVDEMGILPQLYALADIALIGGSFYKFGGHNPLEAVWYERAVIIGEHHQSCIGTVEKLLTENGIIISNIERLPNDIMKLYNDIDFRTELGKRAKKILIDNQNALQLHWEAITGEL